MGKLDWTDAEYVSGVDSMLDALPEPTKPITMDDAFIRRIKSEERTMDAFMQRMKRECGDLNENCLKLLAFLYSTS